MSNYGTATNDSSKRAFPRIDSGHSGGGGTTNTNESEPLLGVVLLGTDGNDESVNEFPEVSSDPHIGITISGRQELDTLAYSRDPDESTLLSRFAVAEGRWRWRGVAKRLLICEGGGGDPPFVLVCLGLAVGIGICAVSAFAYVSYVHRHGGAIVTGAGAASAVESIGTWKMPFDKVSRESFGDPVQDIMDPSLFDNSLLYDGAWVNGHQGQKNSTHLPRPFLKVPFPTGGFWTNLVLRPTGEASSSSSYSYPIVAYPYSFQWSSRGDLRISYSASRRVIKARSIQDAFAPDMTMSSVEQTVSRHVTAFDSLSVTLRYSRGKSSGFYETYLVQGSPYVTFRYDGLRPKLIALSDFEDIACLPIIQSVETSKPSTVQRRRLATASFSGDGKQLGVCVESESTSSNKAVTGVQFLVTTIEGLIWLVFSSEPITFEFQRRSIMSTAAFEGVIRLALVPQSSDFRNYGSTQTSRSTADLQQLILSSGVKRLIHHADAYPVGGSVSWKFRSGTRMPMATAAVATSKGSKRNIGGQNLRKLKRELIEENNIGKVSFAFDVRHLSSSPQNANYGTSLLMLSLPHHAASISSAEELLLAHESFDISYESIKGRMVPVIGNTWSYEEELTLMGFGDEPRASPKATPTSSTNAAHGSISSVVNEAVATSTLDQSIRDLIMRQVDMDLKINLPIIAQGAYGFGKQIARLAQLSHIADVVGKAKPNLNATGNNSTLNDSAKVASRGFAMLEKYLTMWLAGDGNGVVFDANLGGILSKEGMTSLQADFGNARYNDHLFHYGYVLYAAAILGRANPKFISQYGQHVDSFFYDVANDVSAEYKNGGDVFFPRSRHKSWYDGHSFASGLFMFANGKNQESSSEAVNCYYGAYLWAKIRWKDGGLEHSKVDFARLLLATEITGAKTYWHMTTNSTQPAHESDGITDGITDGNLIPTPYSLKFRQNLMVGNLGMSDVVVETWFGTESIYVHMINFLPVTSISAALFDKSFVEEERRLIGEAGLVEDAWRGYDICNHAISDPNEAWLEAQGLSSLTLDSGLSKSQVLFWVSTRDGFLSSTTIEAEGLPGTDDQRLDSSLGEDHDAESRCTTHKRCMSQGLSGFCCPTNEGVLLNCCR